MDTNSDRNTTETLEDGEVVEETVQDPQPELSTAADTGKTFHSNHHDNLITEPNKVVSATEKQSNTNAESFQEDKVMDKLPSNLNTVPVNTFGSDDIDAPPMATNSIIEKDDSGQMEKTVAIDEKASNLVNSPLVQLSSTIENKSDVTTTNLASSDGNNDNTQSQEPKVTFLNHPSICQKQNPETTKTNDVERSEKASVPILSNEDTDVKNVQQLSGKQGPPNVEVQNQKEPNGDSRENDKNDIEEDSSSDSDSDQSSSESSDTESEDEDDDSTADSKDNDSSVDGADDEKNTSLPSKDKKLAAMHAKISSAMEEDEGNESVGPLRTKNEQDYDAIKIPRPDITLTTRHTLEQVGKISAVMEKAVIISSADLTIMTATSTNSIDISDRTALDSDSLLAFKDRTILGRVFETFGPVRAPLYIVRFNSSEEMKKEIGDNEQIGTEVFAVKEEVNIVHAKDVQIKGYDSSNIYDEEVHGEEFSDDEAEVAAKRKKRAAARKDRDGDDGEHETRRMTTKRPKIRDRNRGDNDRRRGFQGRRGGPPQSRGWGRGHARDFGRDQFNNPRNGSWQRYPNPQGPIPPLPHSMPLPAMHGNIGAMPNMNMMHMGMPPGMPGMNMNMSMNMNMNNNMNHVGSMAGMPHIPRMSSMPSMPSMPSMAGVPSMGQMIPVSSMGTMGNMPSVNNMGMHMNTWRGGYRGRQRGGHGRRGRGARFPTITDDGDQGFGLDVGDSGSAHMNHNVQYQQGPLPPTEQQHQDVDHSYGFGGHASKYPLLPISAGPPSPGAPTVSSEMTPTSYPNNASTGTLAKLIKWDQDSSYIFYRWYNATLPRFLLLILEISGHGVLWLIFPILFFLVPSNLSANSAGTLFNFLLLTLLDLAVIGALKPAFARKRPAYNSGIGHVTIHIVDQFSFPSGHATRAGFLSSFAAYMRWVRSQDAQVDPFLQSWFFVIIAFSWAFAVSASRVALGRHHFLDIIFGYVIGCTYVFIWDLMLV